MFGPSDHRTSDTRKTARLTVVGRGNLRPQRPITLLYVEDDEDDVFLVRRHLSQSGRFAVEFAHAPTLAAARAMTARHRFDVVLCDFWLGSETTIPLVDELKADPDCKVVLVSSLENEDIELIGRRAGAAGYVAKDDLSAAAFDRILATLLPEETDAVAEVADARQAGGVGPWLRALMRTLDRASRTTDLRDLAAGQILFADAGTPGHDLRGDVIHRLADLERASRQGGIARFDVVPYLADAVATLRVRAGRGAEVAFVPPYLPVPIEANPAIFADLVHGFFAEALDVVRSGRRLVVTPRVRDGALLIELTVAATGPARATDGDDAARIQAAAEARRFLVETLVTAAGGSCSFGDAGAELVGALKVPLRPL